jgi:transcription elongation factor GreA-like protein/transcription elongation GreA/GreB family factor
MREEFEKMVAAGKITSKQVDPLVTLAKGGYCTHRSWGFGKITTVDTVFGRFIIDFQTKAGHTMDLAFAAETLRAIPTDHILARKAADIGALRQMAALHHLDLIKLVLQSFGGKATQEQIQQVLVPDVITEDWKKWWEAAKKEMKKDGHFQIPVKKTDPVVYQSQEISVQDRLLADFRAAKGLKARLAVVAELHKSLDDLTNRDSTVSEVVNVLNIDINSHQRTQPALALEAIFLRDELRLAAGLTVQASDVTASGIWQQNVKLTQLLEQMPAAKHKRALLSYQEANPNLWHEGVLGALNSVPAKLAGECTSLLMQQGKLDALKETLAKFIGQHAASSELLLWLAKERSDTFADILGPEVFRAMLTAMERDQFNERKSNRLRDYIMDDQQLIVELIGSADLEVIKDLTRALQLSPCFDDMDKRSLLARIVKTYPAIQSLISGEQTKQDHTFVVSWESLERRKLEYDELVHKKIPANSKEIAIARSYGDLRENHEYKAAKEMRKVLDRRKAELENELVRARGTDFTNPRTDAVSIGTRVKVTDLADNHAEQYTILGAWDGDPDKGVISYLTPLAKSLLNAPAGANVDFENEGLKKSYRIESIEPYKTA